MKIKLLLMLVALTFVSPTFGKKKLIKRVAILETVDKAGNIPYGIKLMIRNKITYAITKKTGYEGFDRVDIASIIDEQEFQRTGMVSEDDIKQLGEMTGADFILIAEVANIDDSYMTISAKILDVQTARVEQTAVVQSKKTAKILERKCYNLAEELVGGTKSWLGKLTSPLHF